LKDVQLPPQIAPVVLGTQHLPDPLQAGGRPLLFVGNHTRFGLYDLPLLVRLNYRTRNQARFLKPCIFSQNTWFWHGVLVKAVCHALTA